MSTKTFSLEHFEQLPDRRPLDKYRTPAVATQALIETFPAICGHLFIDPCAGDGRMPRAFIAAGRFPQALTNDIDPAEPTDTHDDATTPEYWRNVRRRASGFCWVVSNPPFVHATRIALQALETVGSVALLLRGTWLEPAKDRLWLGRRPPRALLVLPRLSFTGCGSDGAACHWMIWGPVEPGIKVYTEKPGQLQLPGGGR